MPRTSVRATAPPLARDEPIREIELPRETGSHGDVLAAIGLADLLDAAGLGRVMLEERGASFAVVPSRPRRPSELANLPHDPGYQFLLAKSGVPLPPGVGPGQALDYQAVRDEIAELRRQESELHAARNQTRDPAERQRYQEAIDELRQRWPISPYEWRRYPPYLILQGHETANRLFAEIAKTPADDFRALVQGALAALAERRPSGVAWKVSTVQVFAPNAAKGYARLKPDSTGRGDKTKDAWADPFVEWLRYRGYFIAAVPVFHGSKGEHIRILVPIPGRISIRAYGRIVAALPTPPRGSSPPKIDSLTTLDLARLLIRQSDLFQQVGGGEDELLELLGHAPDEIVSGLAVTNYQSLGSARAVSALAELAVPGWFAVHSHQDAVDWLAILDEHRAIVGALNDSHSDELALLLGYRRFLERRGLPALDALLDFAGAYGNHVLRAREAGRRARQFSTELLRRVVEAMSSTYASILSDGGFRAVAAAVRNATVGAQIMKARVREGLAKDHREIRYGLLPDLRRASQLSDNKAFLVEVAKFVDLYNAENARRQEMTGRPWHARVSADDLLAFTRLVDAYGASIVGALLCAYGTCTERREAPAGAPEATTSGADAVTGDEPAIGEDPGAPEDAGETDGE